MDRLAVLKRCKHFFTEPRSSQLKLSIGQMVVLNNLHVHTDLAFTIDGSIGELEPGHHMPTLYAPQLYALFTRMGAVPYAHLKPMRSQRLSCCLFHCLPPWSCSKVVW